MNLLINPKNPIKQNMNQLSVQDFTLLSVIGKGTYAKVMLVRNKHENKIYAMKVLKKKYIIQKDQVEHIMTEKQILSQIHHPFLVEMKASFQDEKKLYFVLEYCPGGELFGLLTIKDKLSQEQTKFYAAQILLALEGLHSYGIIYREQFFEQPSLKPENVLIDRQGYLKLTDFGLSRLLKEEDQLAMSVCGTPEYLAPEILRKKGHNLSVDWWCLGCIIYEMITGYPPFRHKNRMQLFEAIVSNGFPIPSVSEPLKNLLVRLLEKNPSQRLGSKGAEEVKSHPWFDKIKWDALTNKAVKAPFAPVLSSDVDTSNFDEEFTGCSVESYQENKMQMDQEINQGKFSGFSFENQ